MRSTDASRILFLALLAPIAAYIGLVRPSMRTAVQSQSGDAPVPRTNLERHQRTAKSFIAAVGMGLVTASAVLAEDAVLKEVGAASPRPPAVPVVVPNYDFPSFKLSYFHENLPLQTFLGKASIVFNMKLDDPQTINQFPSLREIYFKYKDAGLSVLAFPSEQGYFEPDDDETIRAKSREYFGFGAETEYPHAVVFDKVDFLGPSQHPLYNALTTTLLTPNGYGRITLNYEKFLLDGAGRPVRRYPRKYSAYDMEADVEAVLAGAPLPEESPAFLKAWREAKREAVKSEYAFRYNYNYYTSPDSMYKYNPAKDSLVIPPTPPPAQ